jgi:Nif-specific regulatory protein
LRKRGPRDIDRLARYFAVAAARRHGKPVPTLSLPALERLQAHSWPGNVRELEHCIESAVVIMDGAVIAPEDLALADRAPSSRHPAIEPLSDRPPSSRRPASSSRSGQAGGGASVASAPGRAPLLLAEVERRHILEVLEQAGGNRSVAAKVLGIGRNTLARKLKRRGV